MRLSFTGVCPIPDHDLERNSAYANSLGLPSFGPAGALPLAVVGGGPSVRAKLDVLRAWTGDIWAVNGAFRYLRGEGIEATFYSIDADPELRWQAEGAKQAILADRCAIALYDALLAQECRIKVARFDDDCPNGPTSAASVPILAVKGRYTQVHFFGCEGSFSVKSHAYKDVPGNRLLVLCDGREFLTSPQMYMQCEWLAGLIRAAPEYLINRSSGLLGAMTVDPEPEVLAASPQIHEALKNDDKDHN